MGLNPTPHGIQVSQVLPEDDIISPRRGYARAMIKAQRRYPDETNHITKNSRITATGLFGGKDAGQL